MLLDSFNDATSKENIEKAVAKQKKNRTVTNAFDSLSEELFMSFETDSDLSKRSRPSVS